MGRHFTQVTRTGAVGVGGGGGGSSRLRSFARLASGMKKNVALWLVEENMRRRVAQPADLASFWNY
jgi:hypothetical protein